MPFVKKTWWDNIEITEVSWPGHLSCLTKCGSQWWPTTNQVMIRWVSHTRIHQIVLAALQKDAGSKRISLVQWSHRWWEGPSDLEAGYFQISSVEDEHVRRMQFLLTELPWGAFKHSTGPVEVHTQSAILTSLFKSHQAHQVLPYSARNTM